MEYEHAFGCFCQIATTGAQNMFIHENNYKNCFFESIITSVYYNKEVLCSFIQLAQTYTQEVGIQQRRVAVCFTAWERDNAHKHKKPKPNVSQRTYSSETFSQDPRSRA